MKIALIGSTGRAGQKIVDELLKAGHSLRILRRKQTERKDQNVEVVIGDALDVESLTDLTSGCDVVINAVGQLKNQEGFYTPITKNILQAMKTNNNLRYLGITSTAVRIDGDKNTLLGMVGSAIMNLFYPRMIKDKREELQVLAQSEMDWTVLRLPLIKDGSAGAVKVSLDTVGGAQIYNQQIAEFISAVISTTAYKHQCPILWQ